MFQIPILTSDILAMSLDGSASPTINISLRDGIGGSHSYGWGFGWYPGDQVSSMVVKDPVAKDTQVVLDAVTDWSNFRSTVFFCKMRGASKTYSQTETQPFSRSFAGRDWLFMHNGDLEKQKLEALHGKQTRLLEPLGTTDSELAFCHLLGQLEGIKTRRLSEIDPTELHRWFLEFDGFGSSDMCLTDGQTIACFHGSQSPKGLYYARVQPPDNRETYQSDAVDFRLDDGRDTYRTALVVASTPFTYGDWIPMAPGQCLLVRRGDIVWNSAPARREASVPPPALSQRPAPSQPPLPQQQPQQADGQGTDFNTLQMFQAEQSQSQAKAQAQPQSLTPNVRSQIQSPGGNPLTYRILEVRHHTEYEYTKPISRSTHFFRLQPVDDPIQEVVKSQLVVSTPGEEIQFEDVFGNQAVHYTIDAPYTKLSVTAVSQVKIFARPPDDPSLSRRQTSIPLVWMPWQRQMMTPYLLPRELPESELHELTEYAMSFVERNDYQLVKTIEDINRSIYRDYKYVQGITSLHTTAFDVYSERKGVCQDFANLFISLARLLNIPARYRMGYVYTGANYENKVQSDASHAWVEVYFPFVGWRGFDPTNGSFVTQDHIRVACGRNYRDATPTSGTIYKGGGGMETLKIDVKVRELSE